MHENYKKTFKELLRDPENSGNLEEMENLYKILRKKVFESIELMQTFIRETRHLPAEEVIKNKRYVYLLKNGCFALDRFSEFINIGESEVIKSLDLGSDITDVFDSFLEDPSTKIRCECEEGEEH